MPVDTRQLDKALAAIAKEYGSASIRGHDKTPLVRIPTGDPMLDWCIGGGVPLGRWAHFYGMWGSAKTLVAWKIIASAQQMGLSCAYHNAEKQYDPVWAEQWGVDTEQLLVLDGSVIEEVGERLEATLPSVHLHVVDSVASCVPGDELAGKNSDWHPGLAARTWGKVLRRANERFDSKENAVILINQTRDMFGRGGEAPTGGKAPEYLSSLSLQFRRSSWLFKDKNGNLQNEGANTHTMTKDTEPDGIEFQVRAVKSRVSRPNRTARLRLDYATATFDELWALSRAVLHYELVEKSGTWYTFPDGSKAQGEPGIRTYLTDHPEYAQEVVGRLRSDV